MTSEKVNKYRIGDWDVSLSSCTLSKGDVEVKVTPRSMDVLDCLAERHGDVVSHEELLARFWQSTFTSDHAVHKVIAELRSALGDDAHQPRYIRTVPKRGYSLIADVLRPQAPTGALSQPAPELLREIRPRLARALLGKWVLAAMGAATVVLALFIRDADTKISNRDDVVRLAVLPFVNRGLNTENQFLTDGLRESLVNGLSKLSRMEVLSPARGLMDNEENRRSERIADRGRDLNADHVLHGSVQTVEGRMRVTVQLTRASDGIHQYSEQFDLPVEDLFGLQDQIVSNVVSALSVHLDEEERRQMLDWGTTDAIAYERFLRAEFYYNQFSPDDFQRAIDYYLSALEADPDFVNAYKGAATAANNMAVYSASQRIAELTELISSIHREVARLAPGSDALQSINEMKLRMSGTSQVQQEIQLREQIMSGNPPGYAMAHYALFLIGARMYEEASQFLDRASDVGPFEISPDEVWSYRSNIQAPRAMLLSAKGQLQERPYHVSFLGTVATNLALAGDFRQAEMYLERQRDVDKDGLLTHYSEAVIGLLSGEIELGNQAYQTIMNKGEDFNFSKGALSFMLGDVETGVNLWRDIPPLQKRRLFNVTHSAEKYFPSAVLEDPRYLAVLEELDFGISWQRRLMEGVTAMQPMTGVALSEQSRAAYENGRFMSRNNLWSEEDWAELESRKLSGIPAQNAIHHSSSQ